MRKVFPGLLSAWTRDTSLHGGIHGVSWQGKSHSCDLGNCRLVNAQLELGLEGAAGAGTTAHNHPALAGEFIAGV